MTTPFETQELLKRLNDKGMTMAEDVLQVAVTEILDWVHESCLVHENVYVKAAGSLIPVIKPAIISSLDNIDGKPSI